MANLRPMLPADVDQAADMILRHDWGVRREFLAFATTQPACVPMVAEVEGVIVGTGVGTANGAVGWIGTIFLAPEWRGQGLGRAITQAIIDWLESAGARTLVLVATADGRRLYEKMGFEVQTRYRIFEAPGVSRAGGGSVTTVRRFQAADLDAIVTLDREGTGEDRGHIISRFATPESSMVRTIPGGGIDGFVIRAPWGGGATIVRSVESAMAVVAERRVRAGLGGRVNVGLLQDNEAGIAALAEAGFSPRWAAPRMVRGDPMRWHPDWVWGQFNHAIG